MTYDDAFAVGLSALIRYPYNFAIHYPEAVHLEVLALTASSDNLKSARKQRE
ncbi:MAG: hypothetical protein SFY80_00445 [Verrucomicrobiota bacterium]|nr:hypothetical protein [Verrucomicrobiota bacterium]